MYGKMQASGLTEFILFIWSSSIWGHWIHSFHMASAIWCQFCCLVHLASCIPSTPQHSPMRGWQHPMNCSLGSPHSHLEARNCLLIWQEIFLFHKSNLESLLSGRLSIPSAWYNFIFLQWLFYTLKIHFHRYSPDFCLHHLATLLNYFDVYCIFSWVTLSIWTGGSDGKESVCDAGDAGLIPGLGKSPVEGNGNPLQYYCVENFMDGGAWQATAHGIAKSQTRLSN